MQLQRAIHFELTECKLLETATDHRVKSWLHFYLLAHDVFIHGSNETNPTQQMHTQFTDTTHTVRFVCQLKLNSVYQ